MEDGEIAGAASTELYTPSICHLIASNFAGGPEKQILELSTRLRESGWPVVIGSFCENRANVEIIERATARSIPNFLLDTKSPYSPLAIFHLRAWLAEFAVEILVTHGYKSNVVGRLATLGTDVTHVASVRGYTGETWRIRLYETLDRAFLRTSDQILCVSHATRRMVIRHGLKPECVHVVHNAVDSERAIRPLDLRAEFSLPANAKTLVAAGRLSPEKGHRILVEAMKRVVERDSTAHLIILGSGTERDNIQFDIDRSGLSRHVHLAGFRRDVPACLAGADLVVNPSHTEGLPNVVLEALAVHTPVVATDVGGVNELIIPTETGWLVNAGDSDALAETIATALADEAGRAAMAEAGFRHVTRSFSFSEQTRQFIAFCTSLRSAD